MPCMGHFSGPVCGSSSCCRKSQGMSRSLSGRIRRVVLAGAVGAALVAMPNHAQAANDELAPKHINLNVQKAKDAKDSQAAEDQANAKAKRPPPGPTSNGISYHGGPLIRGGTD